MKKTVYQTNFERLQALCPDLLNLQPGDYQKSHLGGCMMDLNLDVLRVETVEVAFGMKMPLMKRVVVALSHYYQQNGDMIADPDMEIAIYPATKMVEALTFQDWRSYSEVYPSPGKYHKHLLKDLNSFLRQWLSNCKEQRHNLTAQEELIEVAA